MKITKQNPFTGEYNTLDLSITSEQIARWENGGLIQNVMPNLSADEREFLISGIPPGKWEKYLGPED